MKTLLLILLLAISLSAQTTSGYQITDWKLVARGYPALDDTPINGIRTFYWSQSSLNRNEDIVKFWLKVGLDDGDLGTFKNVSEGREHLIMNCRTGEIGADIIIIYFTDEHTLKIETPEVEQIVIRKTNRPRFGNWMIDYFCEQYTIPSGRPPKLKPKGE
jgi:hypothetical protein